MHKLEIFEITNNRIYLPIAGNYIQAGFPSPASAYEEAKLDINDIVVSNPSATFFVRVKGNSMIDANINEGDVLVVDRSLEAVHGKIVIAVVDGEFTVKRLYQKNGITKLVPENPEYTEIMLNNEQELNIWGVVSYIIHKA